MKKIVFIALSFACMQSAFADNRRPVLRGERLDLPMCLKSLDNANRNILDLQNQLNRCIDLSRNQGGGRDQREIEQLRIENQRLNDRISYLTEDNRRLFDENLELRRQIDVLQDGRTGRTLGFFSYAGCKDYLGNIDLKYIISSEGRTQLESETSAKQKLASAYSCSYGLINGKTEEIRYSEARNYCVAGCKDYLGNVDQKYIKSGTGRNETEATFNALKAVTNNFSCSYGVKIEACQ